MRTSNALLQSSRCSCVEACGLQWLWVLAGCDYGPSLYDVGVATACRLVMLYRCALACLCTFASHMLRAL